MPAFLYSIPSAIPGAISRGNATVEPAMLASSGQPTAYGVPVALSSGKVRAITTGDDASDVFAFLVRPYPATSSSNDFADVPPTSGPVSLMRRGYMGVKVNAGTASYGSPVYVRVDTPSGAKVIGGVEAVADSTHTVQIAGAYFCNASDSDSHAEVAFNI